MKTVVCPITGVNVNRLLLAVIGGFVFLFCFDYLVHNILLLNIYLQTPELWRSPDDIKLGWMITHQFLIVLFSAFIFAQGYAGKGLKKLILFALLLGLLLAVVMSSAYAWMPISQALAWAWAGSGIATGIGLTFIFDLLYRTPK